MYHEIFRISYSNSLMLSTNTENPFDFPPNPNLITYKIRAILQDTNQNQNRKRVKIENAYRQTQQRNLSEISSSSSSFFTVVSSIGRDERMLDFFLFSAKFSEKTRRERERDLRCELVGANAFCLAAKSQNPPPYPLLPCFCTFRIKH